MNRRKASVNVAGSKVLKIDDASWHIQAGKTKPSDSDRAKASAHIACFVYWALSNGYINAKTDEAKKDAAKSKKNKLRAEVFIEKHMNSMIFSDSFGTQVRDFVLSYYTVKPDPTKNTYFDDYAEIICKERDMYSFMPIMKDKKALAKVIDKRLAEFNESPYSPVAKKQKLWPLVLIIVVCVAIVLAIKKYEFDLILPK